MATQDTLDLEPVLRNIPDSDRFSFDIGARQIKVVYTSFVPKHQHLVKEGDKGRVTRLHCVQFPYTDLPRVLDYIRDERQKTKDRERRNSLTGLVVPYTSTHKDVDEAKQLIEEKLGCVLHEVKEDECLVRGTSFLLHNILDEMFLYDHSNDQCPYIFSTILNTPESSLHPYVLVNIGTGTSVEGEKKYTRLGGSHIGGGSFFGLARLLSGSDDVDTQLNLAENGDHRKVDALVSDIYGDSYNMELLGLPPDIIAGSFGKCSQREYADKVKGDEEYKASAVRSLLFMCTNEIGQLVTLMADYENVQRIIFHGYMVRNHPIIMRAIAFGVNFWSKGKLQAHFLRHEAYTGAIGALINEYEETDHWSFGVPDKTFEMSFREHYAGCSDLGRFVPKQPLAGAFNAEVLELDCSEMVLEPFPFLASSSEYIPDTVDLNTDLNARNFWISIFEDGIHKVVQKAVESQAEDETAAKRGEAVAAKFLEQLGLLREKPFAYGSCNVRNFLDLREQLLIEANFHDSMIVLKRMENDLALRELSAVLESIDVIESMRERMVVAVKGVLAGNFFDWGAKAIVELLEGTDKFSFAKAVQTLLPRPWLSDNLDEFVDAILAGRHKSAAIFVDNSGPDVILGILPFARELLTHNIKVIIVTNLLPALNDITHSELERLIDQVIKIDSRLKQHFFTGMLRISHSGQGSPCLDLRRVDRHLCELMHHNEVDLVVIEGMGRALHTNLEAKFTVGCLKAAVVKTQWLADRMGGPLFSVVCRYEPPTPEGAIVQRRRRNTYNTRSQRVSTSSGY